MYEGTETCVRELSMNNSTCMQVCVMTWRLIMCILLIHSYILIIQEEYTAASVFVHAFLLCCFCSSHFKKFSVEVLG